MGVGGRPVPGEQDLLELNNFPSPAAHLGLFKVAEAPSFDDFVSGGQAEAIMLLQTPNYYQLC